MNATTIDFRDKSAKTAFKLRTHNVHDLMIFDHSFCII